MTTITIVDELEIENIEHHYEAIVQKTTTGGMVSVPNKFVGHEAMVIILQKNPYEAKRETIKEKNGKNKRQ